MASVVRWKKGFDRWRSGYWRDLEAAIRRFNGNAVAASTDKLLGILGKNAEKSERRYQQAVKKLSGAFPVTPGDAITIFPAFYTLLDLRRYEAIRHPAFPDFLIALTEGTKSPTTQAVCNDLLKAFTEKLARPEPNILHELQKWKTFGTTEELLQHYDWLLRQIKQIWSTTKHLNRRDQEREKRLAKRFPPSSQSKARLPAGRWTPNPIAIGILSRVHGKAASDVDRVLAEARRIRQGLARIGVEFAPPKDFSANWP